VYTDEITDRQSPSGEIFETDQLAAAFTRSARSDARTVIGQVVAEVEAFAKGPSLSTIKPSSQLPLIKWCPPLGGPRFRLRDPAQSWSDRTLCRLPIRSTRR
jgi:hypothetical protein